MELADNSHISDFTKRTLAQFGWKDGDPIPAELGGLLMQLKENSPRSARTDVLIDINVVPEEGTAAVKQLLAAAKDFLAKKTKIDEINAKAENMAPSVAAAFKQMQLQEEQAQIIDDRDVEHAPAASAPESAPVQEPKPAAPQETQAGAATTPSVPEPLPLPILPFCGRCGWDNRNKFETPITDTDKQDFLMAVLGNKRFKKKFELMGGNLVVTFRTPLAEENRLIHRQLVLDQNAKRIVTEAEWFAQFLDYRCAVSLEKTEDKDGLPLATVPELSEVKYTPPENEPFQTPLVALLDYVNTNVLAHEVTKRLVGTHLRQFQRVVESLEAMALEPSFWNGIE